jgi:phosphomannomutase
MRAFGAFANDGDADRVLGVDGSDRVVNGNHWMRHLARGQDGIVGTIYTNSALREAVRVDGTIFHECDNGDSQVTVKLKELCLTRGGEFTGHLIDLNHIPSGDGLYMGARLAVALADDHSTLSDAYLSSGHQCTTRLDLGRGLVRSSADRAGTHLPLIRPDVSPREGPRSSRVVHWCTHHWRPRSF